MTWQKASYAAGILFVLLLVSGIVVLDDFGNTPDQTLAYVKDERGRLVASFMLLSSAALLLQWFIAGNARRLARLAGDDLLPAVALVGGTAASALLLVAAVLFAAPGQAFTDGDFTVDASAVQLVWTAGYMSLVGSFMCLGVVALTTCIVARRSGALPGWLIWSGLVLALLQVVAFTFFPMTLMALWLLVLAVVLLARAEVSAAPASATEQLG